jgi:hypothetical protein
MQGIILQEANKLKSDIPKLASLRDEYLFSLVCYKYFYNKGELSHRDYLSMFVDGKDDGGIDLANVLEDSNDQLTLLLIQSKDVSTLANYNDIIDALRKMHTTLTDFQENKTSSYSKKLKQKLKDKLAEVEDTAPILNLVIFHNAEISDDRIEKINEVIRNEEIFESYTISIFDRKDIEEQIKSVQDPHKYVEEAKINIDKSGGHIEYGENGLLVNVYASSIRSLYDRFKDSGLFEQNFRYFIKNKKIDDSIKESLTKRRDKFWFLNNGIIIGCRDFQFDHDNVKAYDFSIINGCQTATLIGEYKGPNANSDFVIPCKFVKPEKNSTDNQFEKFISEIAESSNSQKPISDRDLKSNKPEQRKLQTLLRENDPKIYLEIKRGETKKRNIESWQHIVNDQFGQLVLSFNFQQPGTARSGKKKIFADEIIYHKIFKRNHDINNIIDLLKLNQYFNEFLEKKIKEETFTDTNQENVASNGRLITIAIIGFFVKLKRNKIDLKKISSETLWENEIQQDNVSDSIFISSLPDDFQSILESFFLEIIQELADVYSRGEEKYKTVSNFFKIDSNYSKDILRHFKNKMIDLTARKKILDEYLAIFK